MNASRVPLRPTLELDGASWFVVARVGPCGAVDAAAMVEFAVMRCPSRIVPAASLVMRWLACLCAITASLHLSLAEAHACTMVSTIPGAGALGDTRSVSPRNVAFLSYGPQAPATLDVARAADGTIVQARLSRELPLAPGTPFLLYTLDAPLVAGTRFDSLLGGGSFETGSEILAAALPATELRGARVEHHEDDDGCFRNDSCGASTTLDLDRREEPGAAFYGVYYGDSREAVAAASAPNKLTLTTYLDVAEAFRHGDRFVAVTIFDRAGHESAKSNIVLIANEGEEGCSAAPHSSGILQGFGWMVLAAALDRIRRRRGRRAHHHA